MSYYLAPKNIRRKERGYFLAFVLSLVYIYCTCLCVLKIVTSCCSISTSLKQNAKSPTAAFQCLLYQQCNAGKEAFTQSSYIHRWIVSLSSFFSLPILNAIAIISQKCNSLNLVFTYVCSIRSSTQSLQAQPLQWKELLNLTFILESSQFFFLIFFSFENVFVFSGAEWQNFLDYSEPFKPKRTSAERWYKIAEFLENCKGKAQLCPMG